MILRWLGLDDFPSDLDLSRNERRMIRRLASRHRTRDPHFRKAHRRYLRVCVPFAAAAGVVLLIWLLSFHRAFPMLMFSNVLIIAGSWYALHRTRQPYIRAALCRMGYEICIDCGHWLRGLPAHSDRCPECGERIRRLEACADCGYLLRGLAAGTNRCPECGTPIQPPLPLPAIDADIRNAMMRDFGHVFCHHCNHLVVASERGTGLCPECGRSLLEPEQSMYDAKS